MMQKGIDPMSFRNSAYNNREDYRKVRTQSMPICECALGFIVGIISLVFLVYPAGAAMKTGINMTEHNLSVSGPGPIKSGTETRICIFCHTPHNAQPMTPLWNKRADAQTYTLYSSTTMVANVSQPTGPSRLCLSCHDGTIALGDILNPSGGITDMNATKMPSGPSLIANLDSDHPISFSYYAAANDPQIRPDPPMNLTLYGQSFIECSTCHDPHDDTYGKFLVMDNRGSALCVECHDMKGWLTCDHRNSTQTLSSQTLSLFADLSWTNWQTVADYGCEGCHKMHNAGGPPRLMRYQKEEDNCYDCHDGTTAQNIKAEFLKTGSHHPVEFTTGVHQPNEPPELITDYHVECADCHNPHTVNSSPATLAGGVSGMTGNVSGMDRYGSGVIPAIYQYQICFKCHSSNNFSPPSIPRWLSNSNNMRLAFDTGNPSYHPIEAQGKNTDVPSLISPTNTTPSLNLTTASIIYCTDCHDSDDSPVIGGNGTRGPHGSIYPDILREQYNTSISAAYSTSLYALCYRCHSESSILSNVTFQQHTGAGGHSGHIEGSGFSISCSVCHDPHGVYDVSGGTGSHTKLINFDGRYVQGPSDGVPPTFTDKGSRSGSCTLVCHMPSGTVITHDGVTSGVYP